MKIVPYRKGFGCQKNGKDNWGIAGATNEVATLKEAVAAAEHNAAAERTGREKHEARCTETPVWYLGNPALIVWGRERNPGRISLRMEPE